MGTSYITPRNGTINEQSADLAVSVEPDVAGSLRVQVPNFTSSVPGARLFPGGGWALTLVRRVPALVTRGSVYVVSDAARRAQLQLDEGAGAAHPVVRVTVGGQRVPTVTVGGVVRADLQLRSGSTPVDLTLPASPTGGRAGLGFTGISLRPLP